MHRCRLLKTMGRWSKSICGLITLKIPKDQSLRATKQQNSKRKSSSTHHFLAWSTWYTRLTNDQKSNPRPTYLQTEVQVLSEFKIQTSKYYNILQLFHSLQFISAEIVCSHVKTFTASSKLVSKILNNVTDQLTTQVTVTCGNTTLKLAEWVRNGDMWSKFSFGLCIETPPPTTPKENLVHLLLEVTASIHPWKIYSADLTMPSNNSLICSLLPQTLSRYSRNTQVSIF